MPLRTVLILTLGLWAALPLGGCYVSCEREEEVAAPVETPPGPAGPYAGAIRAADTLSFSSDRTDTLAQIAAKPDIAESDQLAVLRVLRRHNGYSSDNMRVLEALCRNPATTARARMAIGTDLERLVSFSSDRKRIADLLANPPAGQ